MPIHPSPASKQPKSPLEVINSPNSLFLLPAEDRWGSRGIWVLRKLTHTWMTWIKSRFLIKTGRIIQKTQRHNPSIIPRPTGLSKVIFIAYPAFPQPKGKVCSLHKPFHIILSPFKQTTLPFPFKNPTKTPNPSPLFLPSFNESAVLIWRFPGVEKVSIEVWSKWAVIMPWEDLYILSETTMLKRGDECHPSQPLFFKAIN